MKLKENVLAAAIEYLKTPNNPIVQNRSIKRTYKGYVSTFGGSVVQSGIAPACVAFLGDDNKKHVVEAIYQICKRVDSTTFSQTTLKDRKDTPNADISSKTFRNKMSEAAVALKLAMRTYNFID